MDDLHQALTHLAHTIPEIRRHLLPLLRKYGSEGTFEDYVEGKTFRNPESGNKVKFDSLPEGEQKKVREHWQEASDRGTDEDKKYDAKELLSGYNLSIVGGDKKRALYVAKKVREGIDKSADICKLTPPVCEGNLGIGRDNMPQIMDKTVKELLESNDGGERKKGEAAVDMGADPKSDKTIMQSLLDDLKKKGVKVEKDSVPVGKLKATQREIKAGKTFGMADAYYRGKFDPAEDVEIVISSDNHILDGHHRWAALLVSDPDRKMKVIRVDVPMREFLRKSLEFPGVFRADLQDNVIPKDTPLDLNEKKKVAYGDKGITIEYQHGLTLRTVPRDAYGQEYDVYYVVNTGRALVAAVTYAKAHERELRGMSIYDAYRAITDAVLKEKGLKLKWRSYSMPD